MALIELTGIRKRYPAGEQDGEVLFGKLWVLIPLLLMLVLVMVLYTIMDNA